MRTHRHTPTQKYAPLTALSTLFKAGLAQILVPQCAVCDIAHRNPNRLCSECAELVTKAALIANDLNPKNHLILERGDSKPGIGEAGNKLWLYRGGANLKEGPVNRKAGATNLKGVDHLVSAFRYTGPVTTLITRWKYQKMLELTLLLAELTAANINIHKEYDLVTVVPTHWQRRFTRGFDHLWLLANALTKIGAIAKPTYLLRQSRRLPYQHLRSRKDRYIPVCHFQTRGLVKGMTVLVIDDVITTGNTLSAVAASLRNAGAVSVDALTVASAQQSITAPFESAEKAR